MVKFKTLFIGFILLARNVNFSIGILASDVKSLVSIMCRIGISSNAVHLKEIEMSANRLFTLFVAKTLIVVIAFTAEVALSSANSMEIEAKEQVQREQELDERYREIRGYILEEDLASLSYISRLNRCFDLPFSELASCRNLRDEQYQELPGYIDEVSPGQIRWEYMLSVSN